MTFSETFLVFLVILVVFLGVKFGFRKSCLCKRNDKYEVCIRVIVISDIVVSVIITFTHKNRPTFMGIFIFSFHQYLPGLWPLLGQNLCNHDTLESELERFIRINVLLLHVLPMLLVIPGGSD